MCCHLESQRTVFSKTLIFLRASNFCEFHEYKSAKLNTRKIRICISTLCLFSFNIAAEYSSVGNASHGTVVNVTGICFVTALQEV